MISFRQRMGALGVLVVVGFTFVFRIVPGTIKPGAATTRPTASLPLCPPAPEIDPEGVWSATDGAGGGWTWHPGPHSNHTRYYTTWNNPAALQPHTLSSLLNQTSIVFYGSSHLRELVWALLRLELGRNWNAELSQDMRDLPSGINRTDPCDPSHSGWVDGLYGVDLEKCGPPARKMMLPNLVYGFKTFLHTPDAEDHFLNWLETNNLRHPEVFILDIGIWGLRGNKLGGSVRTVFTPDQEWDYYIEWIRQSFPQSHIVVLTANGDSTILERLQGLARNSTISILRKDILTSRKSPNMPCGHGCAGPVVHTMAVQLLEWFRKRHVPCNEKMLAQPDRN